MTIKLLQLGKTADSYVLSGIKDFENRLKHYCKFETLSLNLKKNIKFSNIELQKAEEAKLLLANINDNAFVILLDENGQQYTSEKFAQIIQSKLNTVTSEIIFVIGGPFGFSEEMYKRANHQLALSKMTLTHQMVRLFFTEQLYRAFTILKGEKYHH